MDVKGSTAVVIGGASGMGAGTARRLHEAGANVVIGDISEEMGRSLAEQLGERATFIRTDVTRSEDLQEVMDLAARRFGPLRIMVNTAGICTVGHILSKSRPQDMEVFKKTIAVNLTGAYDALRLAAQKMATNEPNEWGERGVIVKTASNTAFDGPGNLVAYVASKAGLVGITLSAARDLCNFGIRVMTIAPGITDTPMLHPSYLAKLPNEMPFPVRPGRVEEFASLVQHIIENPMLNGETIRWDGAQRVPFER